MTNITFKNGLPLLLQPAPGSDIGLVAADSGCCCPPPPPERCWCGSFCSYFIELVEPSELAVKTTAIDCTNQSSSESKTIPTLLAALFAVTGQEIWPTAKNQSVSIVSNFGSLAASSACEIIGNDDFVEGDPGQNYQLFDAIRAVGFSVGCGMDPESGQPVMKGRLSLRLQAGFSNFAGAGSEGVRRDYYGEFDIPSTCVVSPERECFPEIYDSPEFLRIDTPLEITISGDGTSSLGSLDLTADETFGDGDTGLTEDAIGVLAEATSYTFRITARENCLPPENVCCCEGISGISEIDPDEECEGDVLTKPGEPTDIDTMTVVVEWDGLTAELNSGNGFNSGVVSEGIDTFTCVQPGPFPIEADLRQITFASVSASSNICNLWRFSGSLQLLFEGVGPFGGPVGSGINLDIFVSECHDGYVSPFPAPGTHPSWCPNDYAEPVVTLVIAP